MLAAVVGCTMVMTVLSSCSNNTDNPAPGSDKKIVGNWLDTNEQDVGNNPHSTGGGKLE